MHEDRLRLILSKLASGESTEEKAFEELRNLPYEKIGFACIDHHRQLRQSLPEVIFCPGKTTNQIIEIAACLKKQNDLVIATRASTSLAEEIKSTDKEANYDSESGTLYWGKLPEPDPQMGKVALVTAGTADLKIAKEAELILSACKIKSELFADIGVAGLHRVMSVLPQLQEADLCIVVAGMDGVLASVVGGLVKCPVIACPSSIGYGSSFEGLAALLTMLNSCAAGVLVVNIDNGFGAAVAAFRILRTRVSNNSML